MRVGEAWLFGEQAEVEQSAILESVEFAESEGAVEHLDSRVVFIIKDGAARLGVRRFGVCRALATERVRPRRAT